MHYFAYQYHVRRVSTTATLAMDLRIPQPAELYVITPQNKGFLGVIRAGTNTLKSGSPPLA
jgi:hypothetical protein